MMGLELNEIKMPYLILCEGIDIINFMIAYLESDALKEEPRFSSCIQTLDFGGITQLGMYLSNIRNMDGFEKVKRIMVLRDAEDDPEKAKRNIIKSLKDNQFQVPDDGNYWSEPDEDGIRTAYTLLPTCIQPYKIGALEDLCWEILADEKVEGLKQETQSFVSHIKEKYSSISAHEHKSRLHTFFSLNENLISLKIGEASRAGAFDWKSERLEPLKNLIEEGFED